MRTLLWAALPAAALALAVTPTDAYALMIAMRPAPQRALSADVVVVGKVASVTADPVDAASPYPPRRTRSSTRSPRSRSPTLSPAPAR